VIAPAVAATTLRRTLRDRTGLFFMVVLPVLVIVLVGSTMASEDRFAIGVVDDSRGPLAASIVDDLRAAPVFEVQAFDDASTLRRAVRRSELSAGLIIPAGLGEDPAPTSSEGAGAGGAAGGEAAGPVAVGVVIQPASATGLAAEQAVRAVVADRSAVISAAAFAAGEAGGTADQHLTAAAAAADGAAPLTVETTVGGEARFLPLGFTYSSATMLVLFVFVNALAGGGVIIENRQRGLYERMLAAPVTPRAVIAGEATTYLLLALLQSALIVGVGTLLFGVDWGDPLAAAALVVVWATVGATAGMLTGTLLRTVEQAGSIGPMVGIALGMLGGCMWPLEIVPPVMQTIGHLVPHGWAVDSWIELLSRGGGLADIAPALGVLTAFALAFGALAAWRLRRQLTA
jgi:ABC-2 type transport system permease protein